MATTLEATAAPVKLTVNLPPRVWEVLKRLAEEQGITKTEALRRAISTEAFRHEVQKSGGRIMVERKDGSVERVVFPY
jgi:Ribbon-helix-helix protein, copG family